MQLPRAWFRDACMRAGVETAVFSPLLARKTPGPRNLRNHRKWVIADGALCGPAGAISRPNISAGPTGLPPWLDLSFDLEGPVAASAAAQFEVGLGGRRRQTRGARRRAGGGGTRGHERSSCRAGPTRPKTRCMPCSSTRAFTPPQRMLAVTPYFVPDASSRRRHALGRPARRQDRFVHPGQIESSPGGFCAQSLAACVERRRRRHPFAARG